MQDEFMVPVLILVGDKDDWVSPANCRTLAAATRQQPVDLHVYPGATHDYDVPMPPHVDLGHRVEHNPAATADSRKEVIAFLGRVMR
jgi:dienelactone hydrolase